MEFNGSAPDEELTQSQSELVAQLSEEDIKEIDERLYANTNDMWRKIARVVGTTMNEITVSVAGIPDVFYAERVRHLVKSGLLEHQGQLNHMGYCEVRRATNET